MPSRFTWKSRVQYMDTDRSGGIHFASIFRHVEAAEHEFLRSIGFPYSVLESSGSCYPRVHVECDYISPLRYDDELVIEAGVGEIGRSSFTVLFEVKTTERLAAKARITVVRIDAVTRKPLALHDDFRRALAAP